VGLLSDRLLVDAVGQLDGDMEPGGDAANGGVWERFGERVDERVTATQDQLAVTRWRLDPAASSAEFQVPHFWGLVTVKGHFERLDGWLEIDENGQRQITLTIDAASLHTSIGKRDKHLRSAAFFDTQNHPEVRFRSTSVSDAEEDRLRVEGELEVAGERVLLRLDPTIHQTDHQLDVEAATTVDQRLLGMTWSPLGMTRTPATLTVHARPGRES
jgi:polyisoprenoid-binding protein YceI